MQQRWLCVLILLAGLLSAGCATRLSKEEALQQLSGLQLGGKSRLDDPRFHLQETIATTDVDEGGRKQRVEIRMYTLGGYWLYVELDVTADRLLSSDVGLMSRVSQETPTYTTEVLEWLNKSGNLRVADVEAQLGPVKRQMSKQGLFFAKAFPDAEPEAREIRVWEEMIGSDFLGRREFRSIIVQFDSAGRVIDARLVVSSFAGPFGLY
jgi:hypothetical protein